MPDTCSMALSRPITGNEVVITGISGRFPKSENVDEFFTKMMNGEDLLSKTPSEWNLFAEHLPRRMGALNEKAKFDSGFFGLHHYQADALNPASRMLLESTVEAVLDAGFHPSDLKGTKTGVFVGMMNLEFELPWMHYKMESPNFGVTSLRSTLADRIAHYFEIDGPAVCLDSACSSTGYALEHAFRAIRTGRCENAIVGGANLILSYNITNLACKLGVLDPKSENNLFNEHAQGYTRSDAVSAVFLQKLKNSRRVYAQVLHTKTNVDGFKEQSLLHPSGESQEVLLREVYQEANIDPAEINFLEAHATGTRAGGPEEINAVDSVFCQNRETPLLVGSVKSHMGHSEAASGLCSLIKVIIGLETNRIPPNINCDNVRQDVVAFREKRILVATDAVNVEKENLIGITNSGFGGTNSHVVLRRFTQAVAPAQSKMRLMCVSGPTAESLDQLLRTISNNKHNESYLVLLQQIFRRNFETFHYRGFILLEDRRVTYHSMNRCLGFKFCLEIHFNTIDSNCVKILNDFSAVPFFAKVLKRTKRLLNLKSTNQRSNVILLQTMIIELLKLLEVPIDYVSGSTDRTILNNYGISNTNVQDTNIKQNNEKPALVSLVISSHVRTTLEVRDVRSFFIALGRLYELGFNPNLEKLYARHALPIKAPSISPSIKWYHHENWHMPQPVCQTDSGIDFVGYTLDDYNEHWAFLEGHVIDGRNLFPASAFLYFVWTTFLKIVRLPKEETKIVFQNVKFHQPLVLTKGQHLVVVIQIFRKSNRFELSHSDELMVSGSIKIARLMHDQSIEDLQATTKIKKPLLLNSIYKHLNLQHYNYKDQFRGLLEIDTKASKALVKWNENWITYIDHLLSMNILRQKKLMLPSSLDRLVIDPSKRLENGSEMAYSRTDCNLIKSSRVEIRGLGVTSIVKRLQSSLPVLMDFKFVPYMGQLSRKDAIWAFLQIVKHNVRRNRELRIVELASVQDEVFAPSISEALSKLQVASKIEVFSSEPLDVPNFTVRNRRDNDIGNETDLVVVSGPYKEEVLIRTAQNLREGAFILGECLTSSRFDNIRNTEVISTQIDNTAVYLLRKSSRFLEPRVVRITRDLKWISELQTLLGGNERLLLLSEEHPTSGILGFINTLKLEYSKLPMSCMFLTENGRRFDLNDVFFREQYKKFLLTNVLQNGAWGIYAYFPKDLHGTAACENVVGTIYKGNIPSFHWSQGPPLTEKPFPLESNLLQTYCCGLNFKDLMVSSGKIGVRLSDEGLESNNCNLGYECSGRNLRGERVMAVVRGASLSTVVISKNFLTWKIPDNWSFEDAATVPMVYCTVLYTLIITGKLQPRQTILIHSGAGGVGLAALNVATYFECDIFVTVGSMEKRNFLKRIYPKLKDSHIGNTRDSSFEQMVMKKTNGKGVDIVLNSLSEDKLHAGLRCLSKRGQFLDIGQYDAIKNNNFNFSGRSISSFDLFLILKAQVWKRKRLYDIMVEGLRLGYVKPLPRSVYGKDMVTSALMHMSTSSHTGKLIIKIRNEESLHPIILNAKPKFYCDARKVYILVGGLGGFGLQLANWLINRGAQRLVLVSRKRTTTDYQSFQLEILKERGAKIIVSNQNLQTIEGCAELIREAHTLGAIDAIFNLAALLDDALFENQTKDSFESALVPKVIVTANLDSASRQLCPNLRYFVVFSSVISEKGNIGQTNYAMGNSAMERICEVRKEQGFPALAIQWGLIGDVGLLEDYENHLSRIESILGLIKQKIASCLEVLDLFLTQNETIVTSYVFKNTDSNQAEKFDLLSGIAKLMGINLKHVSMHVSLSKLGMDSITSVEIKQFLESQFDIFKSVRELWTTTLYELKQEEEAKKF